MRSFMEEIECNEGLRREFADYQCNYFPKELRSNIPKFFLKKVVLEGWDEDEFKAAVVGVVCQRWKFRNTTLQRALEDPKLQEPSRRFAKKRKVNNSPSAKAWRARRNRLNLSNQASQSE